VAFAGNALDLAILEVGLGGRLDATNVAPARLSVVTSIGLDHTEDLGSTLAQIASEKAGIFRRGRPALARARTAEAREALRAAASAAGAAWHDAVEELEIEVQEVSLEGTRFHLRTPAREATLATPLPGTHQAWNAALAVRAAELLAAGDARLAGARVTDGLSRVRWPGRLERFEVGARSVILDGCHNPEGAEALAGFLVDAGLSGRCHLVFGAMADKDIESIAARLFPAARSVQLAPVGSTRAASAEEMGRRVAGIGPAALAAPGVGAALERALALPGADPIIVAGSLYLVGEARAWLLARNRPEA
jgi:dihydrofolate synthase/folylpolyglutamate synthase